MLSARTYSITELCQFSGFDRRTIVYYSHQGLLPKAGRRGPKTRHSQACLDRLRFIKSIKDLQDQGRCGTITLNDTGGLLASLGDEGVRAALERGVSAEEVDQWLRQAPEPAPATPPPPAAAAAPVRTVGDRRSYGLADAGIRQRVNAPFPPAPASATPMAAQAIPEPSGAPQPAPQPGASAPPLVIPEDLGELLRTLEVRPAMTGRRLLPGASEQWTEIPITSRVYLSVRGLSADDAPLADATARALKKLLRPR